MAKNKETYYDAQGNPVQVKKKRNPFLLGCLGLLLLFVLLGACGSMFGLNDTDKKEDATTEEKTTEEKATNEAKTEEEVEEETETEEVKTEVPTTEEKKDEGTREQKAALGKAKSYSDMMHLSKQGIINQLTSEIEGFSQEDAQYAVDNLKADYKQNALKKAQDYAKTQNMSDDGIYNQLTSEIEGFTAEEAQYAVDNLE
ncbi:Ltp family lipoprotein [Macrococcoides bohemicum]|uniref:Ltp family lipoprotein n=1 Tax=Macrococcoides bohemicum TaxID=1903056 RepID=UPI00289A438D|nr:Ltp family lipoprotein [Macrococcus bohemicus]